MESIFETLEQKGISVYRYKEGEKLCGYELNTYTDGGVNMIIFLDFRGEEKNVENEDKFIEKFLNYIKDFDVDEEVDLHRQSKDYKNAFTISQSVKDFKSWKKEMKNIFKKQ